MLARAVPAVAWCSLVLLALAEPAGGWSQDERRELEASGKVDADLLEALSRGGAVRAMVVFSAPRRGARRLGKDLRPFGDAIARSLAGSLRARRRYRSVNAFSATVSSRSLLLLARHPSVVRVGMDRIVAAQLAEAIPLVGIDQLHAGGLQGEGIRVAVLDTGTDTAHEDLVGAVVAEQCFCMGFDGPGGWGCCPGGVETASGAGAAADDNGHGTKVASLIASNGTSALPGAAPGAEIVSLKVLGYYGTGTFEDVIAGLDWVLSERPDVDLVNVSLGGGFYAGPCDGADAVTMALAAAIDGLRQRGVLVIAGAGNDRDGSGMIAPACISGAVSVGAVWDATAGSQGWFGCVDAVTEPDLVTCFSNSDATTDLFSPGALATASQMGGGVAEPAAGTSYAAPFVSSCAALLRESAPGASADTLEYALEASPVTVVDPKNGIAFPRLDCPASVASVAALAPPVPSLSAPAASLLALALCTAAWLCLRSRTASPKGAQRAAGERSRTA